jgi:hypothetical protein
MPTGYTAYIEETEDPKFEVFVMRCAKAFGACMDVREDPISAPIPEFTVRDYYSKNVTKAKEELKKIGEMSEEDIIKSSNLEYETSMERNNEWVSQKHEEDRKYKEMLKKVKAWTPPSEDHYGLKEFMIDQIKISMHADFDPSDYAPTRLTPDEWYIGKMKDATRNLESAIESYNREVESVAGANKWVRDLRASLV